MTPPLARRRRLSNSINHWISARRGPHRPTAGATSTTPRTASRARASAFADRRGR